MKIDDKDNMYNYNLLNFKVSTIRTLSLEDIAQFNRVLTQAKQTQNNVKSLSQKVNLSFIFILKIL